MRLKLSEKLLLLVSGLFCLSVVAAIPGWFLNFQNLWEYPAESKQFLISLVGIFIPWVGGITGWIW